MGVNPIVAGFNIISLNLNRRVVTHFWQKDFFLSINMKMTFTKNIANMSQGPPNPGFRSVKVEN